MARLVLSNVDSGLLCYFCVAWEMVTLSGPKPRRRDRQLQDEAELALLEEIISSGAPSPGSNPLSLEKCQPPKYAGARRFAELPISQRTKDALA